MHTYVVGSQISQHLGWSPEGYLLCTNVVLCRTGTQPYAERELNNSGSDARVTVHREAEDVLSDLHMGSLEGKPVTQNHPPVFLTPQNIAAYQKGHVQNVRVGKLPSGESCLIGDLIITDRELAEQIVTGRMREVSTGYECLYRERADGDLQQTNFLANHVAIVPQARANAGRPAMVKIMDGGNMEYSEADIAAALDVLAQVSRMFGTEPTRTTDADTSKKNAATLAASYSDAVNATGAKMRGRDCRSNLRRSAEDAAPMPELSLQQRLDAHLRAEEYAEQCRKLHRQGNPLNVR
jgi:hypothetical protein